MPQNKEPPVTIRSSVVTLAVSAGACLAQGEKPDVFERMLDHYAGLDGCTVKMSVAMRSDEPMLSGILESMGQSTPGYAVKPNRFAFWSDKKSEGGMGLPTPSLYSDGEKFISAVESDRIYSVDEAPDDFGDLIESASTDSTAAWQMLPGASFVFGLMSPDPREALGAFVTNAEYQGVEGESPNSYHVVKATQVEAGGASIPLELHISAEGDPWLLSVSPRLDTEDGPEIEVIVAFEDWEATGEIPERGAITPGEDWEEVDDLGQAIMESMQPGGAPEPAESPAGQGEGAPAPDFTLPLLGDGRSFSLASQRGKVVVLDFWATWCPPCVKGLPTMSKVTGEYADRGVVFVAVDLQEDADHVAEFMKSKGWSFTVALDGDGEVSDLFGVSGIPHSVIIDKKGVVRHVHVGFGDAAEAEARLRKELDGLIAEK